MPNNQTILQWDGDVLNRKEIALFLEKLVLKKIESGRVSPNANALCFALDGDWGTGKTFFVKNWIKDLRNSDYPVIHFDAWIGFVAQIKFELGFSLTSYLSKDTLSRWRPQMSETV